MFSDRRYDPEESEFEILNGIKILCIANIVLANTYFNVLSGPLKNLEVVSQWISSVFFIQIFAADYMCDIFYWITGFVMSFNLLKKHHQNGENWWTNPVRIWFERYLRLLPMYMFMMLFLWKFIGLFGGMGPRFYLYEIGHGCNETWIPHLLMINNIYPWADQDYCVTQSWYLANDIWFMAFCLFLVNYYKRSRTSFYLIFTTIIISCLTI